MRAVGREITYLEDTGSVMGLEDSGLGTEDGDDGDLTEVPNLF